MLRRKTLLLLALGLACFVGAQAQAVKVAYNDGSVVFEGSAEWKDNYVHHVASVYRAIDDLAQNL